MRGPGQAAQVSVDDAHVLLVHFTAVGEPLNEVHGHAESLSIRRQLALQCLIINNSWLVNSCVINSYNMDRITCVVCININTIV